MTRISSTHTQTRRKIVIHGSGQASRDGAIVDARTAAYDEANWEAANVPAKSPDVSTVAVRAAMSRTPTIIRRENLR
jgi:hypothetical protein